MLKEKKKYIKIRKIYKDLNFNGIYYSKDENITYYRSAIRKLYTKNHMLNIAKIKEDKECLDVSSYQELKNTNLSIQYPIIIFYVGSLLSFLAGSLSATGQVCFYIIYLSLVLGSMTVIIKSCVNRNKMLNIIIDYYELISRLLDELLKDYK